MDNDIIKKSIDKAEDLAKKLEYGKWYTIDFPNGGKWVSSDTNPYESGFVCEFINLMRDDKQREIDCAEFIAHCDPAFVHSLISEYKKLKDRVDGGWIVTEEDNGKIVHIDRLEVGENYRVEMVDCCIRGEFTSELVEIGYAKQSDFINILLFANGVILTEFAGCLFYSIADG